MELKRPAEAIPQLQASVEENARLCADFPPVPEYRDVYGRNLGNLGELLLEQGRTEPGIRRIEQGLDIRQQLAEEFPKLEGYRAEAAGFMDHAGILLEKQGRRDQAEALFLRAIDAFQHLVIDFPQNSTHARSLEDAREHLKKLTLGKVPAAEEIPPKNEEGAEGDG